MSEQESMNTEEEAIEDIIIKNLQAKRRENNAIGTFRLVYENSAHEISDRVVDIIRFMITDRKRSFYAYCHLRNTFREFSFKGVRKIFSDGKEIENPQEFLLGLYKKLGGTVEPITPNPQLDVIRAIWFFACSDGVYKRHELNVVKKYARLILPNIEAKLGKEWLEKLNTSPEDMGVIAQRLEWTKDIEAIYADAIYELLELKQKRYSDFLRQNLLIDLWEPFFSGKTKERADFLEQNGAE